MRQYLLFDLDRTLWDFDGNAYKTYRSMFDAFDIESLCHVDFDTFHAKYKIINDMLWEAYRNGTLSKELLAIRRFSYTFAAFGLDADAPDVVRLSNKMSDYYVLKGTLQTGLMPGTRDLLEWLVERHDEYSLAVITNGFSEAQRPKMRTSGIDKYFDYFFLSEDLGFMKPDPRFFEAVLKRLGATPDQWIVVGDDYKVDVAGAMTVGIPQVWYNYRGIQLSSDDPKPTYEVKDLQEIKKILVTQTAPNTVGTRTALNIVGTRTALDIVGTRTARPQQSEMQEWHCRGYLPHCEFQYCQFISYRLFDSVPNEIVEQWKKELSVYTFDERRMKLASLIDKYEDAGYGSCYLKDDRIASIIEENLLKYDGIRYDLLRWCIMPNHVHVLINVNDGVTLSQILKSWRSYTAHEANRVLNRTGRFWMPEYFDRYIRNNEHYINVVKYIDNNPVNAGLVNSPEKWRWCSAYYCNK